MRLKMMVAGAVGVALLFVFGWIGVDSALEYSGDAEFCSSCHVMEPVAYSWSQDVHGGHNQQGTAARCVDCHLPWNGHWSHLIGKAQTGFSDLYFNIFTDPTQHDWIGNLQRREEFVFESGCLKCHSALKKAPLGNLKAVVAHQPYFAGETEKTCVSCHEHVGHRNLEDALKSIAPEGK